MADINETNVGLSSPWEIYRKRVYNIFSKDPEVEVQAISGEVVDGVFSFTISSVNSSKLAAIKKILKNDIPMGNITVHIDFEDLSDGAPTVEDFEIAFDGNSLFDEIYTAEIPGGAEIYYAIFNREIISYFSDDLTDYCGRAHEIAADIIRDITIESPEVSICTKSVPED